MLCFTLGSPGEFRGKSLIRKAEKTTVSYELLKIQLVALQSGTYYCNIYVDRQIDRVLCYKNKEVYAHISHRVQQSL